MNRYLEVCRLTYNKCLTEKRQAYEKNKTNLSEFDLNKKICDWRKNDENWMQDCGIAILHDVSRRLNKAFANFFRRARSGEKKVGYPRFKAFNRYDSFTVPRFTFKVKNSKIKLTNGIGWVKIKQHRSISGNPKGYTITKNNCGEWFISITVEQEKNSVPSKPLHRSNNIGIDLGCSNLITLSNGESFKSPKYLTKKQKSLAKAQKARKKLAVCKIHKKIKNQRLDYAHKISNEIIENYDIICCEDIQVQNLSSKTFKNIRKSLTDASWSILTQMLSYKAEDAGKIFIKVNPAYTSQTCSNCGKRHDLKLSDRIIQCECGYQDSRDVNAAKNILTLGLQSLASN